MQSWRNCLLTFKGMRQLMLDIVYCLTSYIRREAIDNILSNVYPDMRLLLAHIPILRAKLDIQDHHVLCVRSHPSPFLFKFLNQLISTKLGTQFMPLEPTPNVVVFNFVQPVTVSWWRRRFVMS